MNSYKRSLDLELVGSDEDKVNILRSLTLKDITKDDAGRFLREENLLKYNGSKWIGTIEDLLDMGRIPTEHIDDIDDLKSVLIGSGGTGLSTSSQKWAAKIAGFVGLLTSITGSTALADKFYDLGGGRPLAQLSVDDFRFHKTQYDDEQEAIRVAEEFDNKKKNWHNRAKIAINSYGTGLQDIGIADLKTIADEMEL